MSLSLVTKIGDRLADVPGVYLCVVDSDLTISYVSQAPLGWQIQDVVGTRADNRVVERDKAAVRNGIKLALLGDSAEFPCRLLGPKGAGILDCASMPLTKTRALVICKLSPEKPKLNLTDKIECVVLTVMVRANQPMPIREVQRSLQFFGTEASKSTLKHVLAGMVRRQLLTSGRGKNAGYAIASGGAGR